MKLVYDFVLGTQLKSKNDPVFDEGEELAEVFEHPAKFFIPFAPFAELPLEEVKKVFIDLIQSYKKNDVQNLPFFLAAYPALFDEQTLIILENFFQILESCIAHHNVNHNIVRFDVFRKNNG